MDVRHYAAAAALARLAADVELQFLHGKPNASPLFVVLVKAREEAITALAALVEADATNPPDILKLQNEVRRFVDLVSYTREIIDRADDALAEIEPEDQEQVRRLIMAEDTQGVDA